MARAAARTAAVLAALALSACANYRPVVDMQGVHDTAQYETDLSDCQRYAAGVDPAARGAAGAVIGGLLGAAIGAIAGDVESGMMAGAMALGGTAGAVSSGVSDQKDIIRRCMSGRGYAVLN